MNEDLSIIYERLDELEEKLSNEEDLNKTLKEELASVKETLSKHRHSNLDGSLFIEGHVPKIAENGDVVSLGEFGSIYADNIADIKQTIISAGTGQSESLNNASADRVSLANLITAYSNGIPYVVGLGGVGIANVQANVPITSSGNTISSGAITLNENELVGHMIVIIIPGVAPLSRRIASNTTNTITIFGTWGVDYENVGYQTFKPMVLGDPTYRWDSVWVHGNRRTSKSGKEYTLIMGSGITGDAFGVYSGKDVPDNIQAVVSGVDIPFPEGSTYHRTGGTNGALYVMRNLQWRLVTTS